jgi:hypothetical protein
MTDDLRPEAILESVAAAYRGFTEYEDAGLVTEGVATLVRFETRFRRGSVFRFSYVAFRPDGAPFHDGEASLEGERFSFRCSLPAPPPTSLKLGIAALTGISCGAAHGASCLLLPDEIGGWLPTDLRSPTRLPDVTLRGRAAFQVKGAHPKRRSEFLLVIDKATYLILRRAHSASQTTDYESCRAT